MSIRIDSPPWTNQSAYDLEQQLNRAFEELREEVAALTARVKQLEARRPALPERGAEPAAQSEGGATRPAVHDTGRPGAG